MIRLIMHWFMLDSHYKPQYNMIRLKKKNKFVSGRWPENLNAKCVFFFFLARC